MKFKVRLNKTGMIHLNHKNHFFSQNADNHLDTWFHCEMDLYELNAFVRKNRISVTDDNALLSKTLGCLGTIQELKNLQLKVVK